MILQDIDVAIDIRRKGIFSLKGKTTRNKTIPVPEELIQVPKKLIKLHRDIVMISGTFFVNTIPFFLTLTRKILYHGTPS